MGKRLLDRDLIVEDSNENGIKHPVFSQPGLYSAIAAGWPDARKVALFARCTIQAAEEGFEAVCRLTIIDVLW